MRLCSGVSFWHSTKRCIVSVQPFSGGQIVLIDYPTKYLLDLTTNLVSVYDLETDPNEKKPLESKAIDDQILAYLESCLQSLAGGVGPSQQVEN